MAIPEINYRNPQDIHVIRGQSINFDNLIRIGFDFLRPYLANNPSMVISFKILCHGAANPDGSMTGTTFNGPGFSFNATTRILQTDQTAPAQEVYNFVFITEGIDTNDEVAVREDNRKSAAIRIHIHAQIVEAWLTPSPLTLFVGARMYQPSIIARYNDGITSKIERQSSLDPVVTPPINITWRSPSGPGLLDTSLGRFLSPTTAGNFDLEATLEATALGINIEALGQVIVNNDLSANSPIKASLVATGNCPGFAKIDQVPNVLFLSDGFVASDRARFNQMVDDYVHTLMHGNVTSPYNLLRGSINFWKAFIPSREVGGTILFELFTIPRGENLHGIPFVYTKPVNLNTAEWSLANLLYFLGPPVYLHSINANTHNGNSPLSTQQIRNFWKSTSSLSDAQIDAIPEGLINRWRSRAHRVMPEETDTALGIMVEEVDALMKDPVENFISLNQKRLGRRNLDDFLESLEDDQGNVIGGNFSSFGPDTGRTDAEGNSVQVTPKDFDNIAMISALSQGRAVNAKGYFFVKINPDIGSFPLHRSGFKTSVRMSNSATTLALRAKATLTHELSHSFGLGDEYGKRPPSTLYNNRFIDDNLVAGWPNLLYKSNPSGLDIYSNLQSKADLWIESPESPGTFRLHAAKLKWRLHRIVKCGVLVAAPTQSGNRITLTLRDGQAEPFELNDIVYLRKRRFREVSIHEPFDGMIIGNITELDAEPIHGYINSRPESIGATTVYNLRPTRSDQMVVKAVNPTSNEIQIETAPSTAGLAEFFFSLEPEDETIVYKPMEAPSGAHPGYPFAELIAHPVLSYLNGSPYPFNAKEDSSSGDQLKEIIDDTDVQESRIPGSLVPSCSRRKKQIVAMYSGGRQMHGHIYHPTAQCLMRSSVNDDAIESLCEVCKYTLVNIIDPAKHPVINEKYSNKIYPR